MPRGDGTGPAGMGRDDGLALLKQQARALAQQMQEIQQRIEQLEKQG